MENISNSKNATLNVEMRNVQYKICKYKALKTFKTVKYSFIEMRAKVAHRNFSNNMEWKIIFHDCSVNPEIVLSSAVWSTWIIHDFGIITYMKL